MLETANSVKDVRVRSTSFLPEEVQNVLQYWRDTFKQGYFEIGDIAAQCIDAFAKSGFGVTDRQIFDEIGSFCGKSGRTVRYYYETAVFYPVCVRERYGHLPFSHFVFARSVNDWEGVLEYASDRPNISEVKLREIFIGIPSVVPENQEAVSIGGWLRPAEFDDDCSVSAERSGQAQEGTRDSYRYMRVISAMRDGVFGLRELIEKMDDDDREFYTDVIRKLEQAVDYLPKVIEKIK